MPAVDSSSRTEQKTDGFSPHEVEAFRRDGYVIGRDLAPASLLQRMIEATRQGLEQQTGPIEYEAELQYPGAPASFSAEGGKTVRRLKQAVSRDFSLMEWISSPSLIRRLQQLLGPDVVMPLAHHNCIMTKEPRFSSDTGWHQDIRYWSFQRPELISVWLALGNETVENGCLRLLPGTHTLQFDRGRLDESKFLRPELPENQELIDRSIHAELKPGDVLFFHCRTFHAATRNHTDRAKYSVVFTFRPGDNPPLPGTRSASLPELLISRSER